MAEFLVSLRRAAEGLEHDRGGVFSIVNYVRELLSATAARRPRLRRRLEPMASFVETELAPVHDRLAVAFCHGDYHPLNVVWAAEAQPTGPEQTIAAVIDWKLSGLKPDLYDLANLIGCVGVEEPRGLVGAFVTELLSVSRGSDIVSGDSWPHLLPFMVALRFARLSEWLRRDDEEMIELETDYMGLLIENRGALERAWGI